MRAARIVPLLGAAALAGCVSWGRELPAVSVESAGPDPAEMRLVEAAERAERALASLARTLPEPDPESRMPGLDAVPAALRRPVTMDWSGPIETLAAELAGRAGYRFAEAGQAPARPLIVDVEVDGEPLIAVLRDLGLRAGGAATLTVDAASLTVLLDWTGPDSARSAAEDG